jgi:hypothetical protein
MESDRQGRAPRGPYFFFFFVAFFFATASPPFAGTIELAFLPGMLVEVAKICQGQKSISGVSTGFAAQDVGLLGN